MEPITATIKAGILNGRNLTPKMEIVAGKSLVALTPEGETREIVNVRWYMGRSRTASVVHCTIWTPENSGTGNAGGYGYDKESAALAEACENAGIILEGALEVIVTVILPVPGSYSKTRRERCLAGLDRPIVRPDLDNYLKCLDALNGIVWKDDSQVVMITAQKKYGEEPRMIVTVLKKGE